MKKKLIYITFNDLPNGIYISQVIDVVKLFQEHSVDAKLIAFLPFSKYFNERKKIKSLFKESIVLPSFPKLINWKLNKFWFFFLNISSDSIIITRSIFATNLFLKSAKNTCKVIYDGRGAIAAEQEEYNVYDYTGLEDKIHDLERISVLKSDYNIAVSSKLIEYWEKEFKYIKGKEVVIPSTISNNYLKKRDIQKTLLIENQLGIIKDDIVMIYSGSKAGWQSFHLLKEFICAILENDKRVKIIFLCKLNRIINELIQRFQSRIIQNYVPHDEVPHYLDIADYGLLLRENSLTNKVASPVKCAEYLSRGLKVIISSDIGDYSEEIVRNNLGIIYNSTTLLFEHNNDRENQIKYVQENLSKSSNKIIDKYMSLMKL